ncbi:MAG: hypothetical protein H8E21_04825 [Gammaproteobacteria bacterium]|nr:hypothetical protein [Gammaproteobacteria bacterium]MBL6999335.1 hypothetical protein [Gammaproteobacteria bacterium]
MKRLIHLSLLLCIYSSSALAIEPGQIKAHSEFYEPFRAAFTVEDIDVSQLENISIRLASAGDYRQRGLSRISYLDSFNFTKIISGQDKQLVVVVTSSERNIEASLDLLVDISDGKNSFTHLYSLILNPDVIGTYIPNPAQDGESMLSENTLSESEMTAEPKMTGNLAISNPQLTELEGEQRKQPEQIRQRETILAKNQGISIIANNSPLHDDYSVYQIMRAFYLLNPQAFIRGNINRLMSGSDLIVPEAAEVAAVNREQAIHFVHSVSRNQPLQTDSPAQSRP